MKYKPKLCEGSESMIVVLTEAKKHNSSDVNTEHAKFSPNLLMLQRNEAFQRMVHAQKTVHNIRLSKFLPRPLPA